MDVIYFDGVALPSPSKYNVSLSDIQSSDSGRNDDGYMTIEIIRSDVATIDIGWTMLTQSELELIMAHMANAEINVKFYYGNNYKTAKMYKGDRKTDIKMVKTQNESYWDLSLSLVEY